jgi:hypothetical protein
MQHLAGLPRRFEISARVIPQTEVQAFTGRGLLDHVGVPLELIADRRPDEIRAVRIEPIVCTENPIRVDNATESPKLAG